MFGLYRSLQSLLFQQRLNASSLRLQQTDKETKDLLCSGNTLIFFTELL